MLPSERLERVGWKKPNRPANLPPARSCECAAICIVNALGDPCRVSDDAEEMLKLVAWAIRGAPRYLCDGPIGAIAIWNDAPERTLEDVMSVLKWAERIFLATRRALPARP